MFIKVGGKQVKRVGQVFKRIQMAKLIWGNGKMDLDMEKVDKIYLKEIIIKEYGMKIVCKLL